MSEHITDLDEKSFDKFTKSDISVVDFWAAWCGPCKMMHPILDETAKEMKGRAKFAKVDVDANGDLAQRFQVMSIPTLIIFRDGEQVDRVSGVLPKDELIKMIQKVK